MSGALAGYESLESVTPRNILFHGKPNSYQLKPGGIILASTGYDGGFTRTYDIRAGWAMGQITTTGQWVPCKRSRVNTTAGAVTEVVLDNADAFIVGDTITIGGDTGIEITAIDYDTNTITIASTTVADNDAVFAEDGSGVCRGFLFDDVRLRNLDNTAAAEKSGQLLISGMVDKAMLLGDIDSIIAAASSMFLADVQIWSNNVRVL